MFKLYIASFLFRQSFIAHNPKNYSRFFRQILWMLLGLIMVQPAFAGKEVPGVKTITKNFHEHFLPSERMYYAPGPTSENFDEVTVNSGGYSQGNSPRTIGDWIFSMTDNAGANDADATLDVTNSTNSSHLADNGNDKALGMTGSLDVSTAAVITPSGGGVFSLTSFNIENGYAASPDYRVVGYSGGSEVISQNFTAKQYNQTGPYTVTLSDAKWKNIDEFRIVRQDGSADVSFYLDDIVVTAVNMAPVVTTSGGTTAFAEGNNVPSTPVVIDGGVTVSDADNAKLISATVRITGNFHSSDILAFSNDGTTMGDIVAAYNLTNGILNLSATDGATVAAWESALRSVTYGNSSENPNASDRTISFAISDGTATSTPAIKTISVTAVDDAPVITSNGGGSTASVNVAENTQAVTTVKATDVDAASLGQAIVYSLSGGADKDLFSIDGITGALAFKMAPDFENPSDDDGDGNYEVTLKASDGSAYDEQAITITVTDVNDNSPVITSNGGGSTASISVPEGNTAVTIVTATDDDAGTTLTYSLSGGADEAIFKINSATGTLEFKTAPDFENPSDADSDNNYEVTVRASDGANTIDQAITVNVTEVVVMPVTITGFTAKAEKNSTRLQWSTGTEINNKAFIISRSADRQTFTEIGKVEGAGNSASQKDYVFYDKNPLNGLNYYRLQQVDFDGKITSYGIRKVEFSLPDAMIKLYPNPVTNYVKVIFAAGNYQQVTLTDNNGKVIQVLTLSSVDTQKTLDLKNLATGVYYIRFTGKGKMEVRKMVKE